MTRKDYVLIAEALRIEYDAAVGNHEENGARGIRSAAGSLARSLSEDNVRFDQARFLRAALGDEGYELFLRDPS